MVYKPCPECGKHNHHNKTKCALRVWRVFGMHAHTIVLLGMWSSLCDNLIFNVAKMDLAAVHKEVIGGCDHTSDMKRGEKSKSRVSAVGKPQAC